LQALATNIPATPLN